jgi:hypothetical protein
VVLVLFFKQKTIEKIKQKNRNNKLDFKKDLKIKTETPDKPENNRQN